MKLKSVDEVFDLLDNPPAKINWREAVRAIVALLDVIPDDAELWQFLGTAQRRAGRLKEAGKAYRRSLMLNPNDAFTHLWLGNWFFHLGAMGDALKSFRKASRLMPDEAIVYTTQGDIHRAQRKYKLAEKAYRKGLRARFGRQLAQRKLDELDEYRQRERAGKRRVPSERRRSRQG